MIDDAVIIFSTLACLIVVFRAIRLDGRTPWYGTGVSGPGPKIKTGRRRDAA